MKKTATAVIAAVISVLVPSGLGPASLVPKAAAAPETHCTKPAIIGASSADYGMGARVEILRSLKGRGIPYFLSTSAGRTVYRPGHGTDRRHGSGLHTVDVAKQAGATCFVIEFGATEAARANGDRARLARAIDAMMTRIGPDYRVDWITPKTRVYSGPFSDRNMNAFRLEFSRATRRYENLDVNHWERIPETTLLWWRPDFVHLQEGSKVRGPYIVDSAFINRSR
ncbi:MAG: hypothetical protein QM809_07565 [Gordonia sp. (in: high G+C Gram-positive bacteria)]|uniref:hypothetical protein n=1 Tax=Gordonia sp. (in: high G+C Gram-positive bacteria) TaxID=84139 RepID=UPI0039E2DC81